MNQKKWFITMRIVAIVLLIFGGTLSVVYQDNRILAIQLYTGLEIPTLLYMIGLLLLVISFIYSDVGFFKFVVVLGIIAVSLAFILFILNNRTRYFLLENEEYRIIVQHTINQNSTDYNFFEKDTAFTYQKFARAPKPNTYESSLYIEEDQIVIEKCDETNCFYDYVELE